MIAVVGKHVGDSVMGGYSVGETTQHQGNHRPWSCHHCSCLGELGLKLPCALWPWLELEWGDGRKWGKKMAGGRL